MGECSLYETATQEVITMYNDEFNNNDMYRFTNREVPRDDYAPAPRQENTYTAPVRKQGFFRRTWVKVTALVLACAVVGGAAGYGGAALAGGSTSGGKTTINESDRTATAVQIKKVDGQTKMQPAEVYASTVNSTVSINCSSQSTNIFGQTTQSASSGSGFIISQDGYIVTNYHVINGASSVKVTLYNGNTYDATVIGGDSDYDVAVLKINAAGLTPVTLPEELQKTVMSIIYDEIKKGETGSREKFGEIDAYLRSVGCDCAILGCTELSVYRTLHSLPPFYIDAMEILAEQAILRCGKQLRNV